MRVKGRQTWRSLYWGNINSRGIKPKYSQVFDRERFAQGRKGFKDRWTGRQEVQGTAFWRYPWANRWVRRSKREAAGQFTWDQEKELRSSLWDKWDSDWWVLCKGYSKICIFHSLEEHVLRGILTLIGWRTHEGWWWCTSIHTLGMLLKSCSIGVSSLISADSMS